MATPQEEYIYCILLPFQCTSQGPSYYLNSGLLGQHPSPQPPESFVAKVGITRNPAKRLSDIYTAFQEFGESGPLFRLRNSTLSSSDDFQTVIQKAKLIADIIFIEKVHSLGNTEKDIRTKIVQTSVIQLGQPELTDEFRESFKAVVPEAKKHYLDDVGITEWIIISNPLAMNLQKQFRKGGICPLQYSIPGSVYVPSGKELTKSLSDHCHMIAARTAPTQDRLIMARSNKRLPLLIEFGALKFRHQFYCAMIRMEPRPGII